MSVDFIKAPFMLVVRTDAYAGNFERDLCAYLTGATGECGVGDDIIALIEVNDHVRDSTCWQNDEHGCGRPVSIYNFGDNQGYKDVAIFFEYEPDQKIKHHVVEQLMNLDRFREAHKDSTNYRVKKFAEQKFAIHGWHWFKNTITVKLEELEV